MSELFIRPANLKDLPILLEFEQGVILAERPFDPTLKNERISYYDIKAMIESDETEVIVALINNVIIGSAYAKIEEAKNYLQHSHYVYLGFMYVKPAFRGKGINKKIIDELVKWAQSKDIQEMRLDVYSDNESAIKAYQKAGFKSHLINMRMEIEKI